MEFAFEEYGAGKPLVLLHAFPLNRKMWQPQIAELISAGIRVILPDFKGFGENPDNSETCSMEEMAREISSLLDYMKIERAVIGGLSMGGYVTFNLLRLFPEKFSALVLFDTTSAGDTEEKRQSRLELIDKIETNGVAALIENMLPNLVSEFTKSEKPDLYRRIVSLFEQVNPKAAIAALRGMAERLDHTHLLPEISVPTLLIFGAEDNVTNLETAKMMKSKIPGSKLCLIPKAGHYSNLEEPEIFNQSLVEFLKNI